MSKLETNTIDNISGSSTLNLGDTNATAVTIDSGVSTVTIPNGAATGHNYPAFFVYDLHTVEQSLTGGTNTKLTPATEYYDTDNAYSSDKFTVPSGKGGKYFIQGTVTGDYADIGQDGEETVASIYKNGSSIQLATWRNSSTVTGTGRVITTVASTIQDLSASDTIELYALIMDASGSNGKVKGEMTTLLGYKLIG